MTKIFPTLYLARHGETAWSLSGQHTGLTDLPLTEQGERNARNLGPRLAGLTFAKVFTSVTGDSRYFLLTDKQRREHRIPAQACRPVVSRARHLYTPILTKKDWDALKSSNQRIWLFKPGVASRKKSPVRRYLERPPENGGCNRSAYKIRMRSPWYDTPLPSQPDGFVSGMSRYGPWICLSKFKRLNATNTLYVVKFHRNISERECFGYALGLLSSPVQRQLRRSARRYADGLIKYEPSALTNLRLPKIPSEKDFSKAYLKAVSSLLSGKRADARRIADRAFDISV